MAKPVSSITIVGGGSSGWLAGAFFSNVFRDALRSGAMTITLIESPNIGIIGVGESTAPAMPRTLQEIGVDEAAFFRKTNASFKVGGKFVGWNVDDRGRPITWINPFLASYTIAGVNPGYYFAEYGDPSRGDGSIDPFADAVSPCPDMIRRRKGPRPVGAPDFETAIPYSYHTDAAAFAEMLRDISVKRGVRHVLDDVVNVNVDERGFISSLDLKENGSHRVELAIDATGFRGVLLQQTLGEPFDSYGDYLLNDRAAVAPIPHDRPGELEPATTATALGAGWSFRAPLYNRVGTGYVFSSAHLSDDAAIEEFLNFLGPRGEGVEPRVIRMKIGKTRRSWVKNCVAIGLSSGFVEPLEATAIYSVDMALRWLYSYFPDTDFDEALTARFNQLNDAFYDEIIDYIVLHFRLSNRTDTDYWRTVREETPIPDSLKENLRVWRKAMPIARDLKTNIYFNAFNYQVALEGKRFYEVDPPRRAGLPRSEWDAFQNSARAQAQRAVDNLPDHYALVSSIRGEPQRAQTGAQKTGALPGLGGGWRR